MRTQRFQISLYSGRPIESIPNCPHRVLQLRLLGCRKLPCAESIAYCHEMSDEKVFRDESRKQRPSVADVVRESQSGCKGANRSVFIACMILLNCVQDI